MIGWTGWTAAALALAWTWIFQRNVPDLVRVPRLPGLASPGRSDAPESRETTGESVRLSVVIAARNEADRITRTLASLRVQTLRSFEVIVVDDRSDDDTWDQVQAAAHQDPRVRGVRIQALPRGWIGKNHALHVGAREARGEWLLFADADVLFHPGALQRALRFAVDNQLDHLTVAPALVAHGYWLKALTAFFTFNLLLFKRPQSAYRPRSRAHAGIGAFNLIRRDVYERIGGHRAIALRPDDDIHLGKLVKQAGCRQSFAIAADFIEIEWYHSLGAMIRGLEKSPLAAFRYSAVNLILCMLPLLVLYGGPYAGVLLAGGWIRAGYAYSLLLMFVLYAVHIRFLRFPLHQFLLLPAALALFVYTFVRAALLAAWRGGLVWRDTFYPLEELRKGL
ncbi:MAG: glycosyltransferase [Alicyclobacillaceae bacterium]|nr:glycosyltransferase [Alicyclobacillaceae bacterium]